MPFLNSFYSCAANKIMLNNFYQEFLKDNGYNIEEDYRGTCTVYRVANGDGRKIAKIANWKDEWGKDHVETEYGVLKSLEGLDGLPKPVCMYESQNPESFSAYPKYGREGFYILIREFIDGKTVAELGKKITDTKAQQFVENTVREVHKQGLVYLDIGERNTIISENGMPYIIDLGSCIHKDNISRNEMFDYLAHIDIDNLQHMFE